MCINIKNMTIALLTGTILSAQPVLAEPKVELMHMWTSGDSAAALGSLKDRFVDAGGTWIDSAAAGATSGQMASLRARVIAGDPPTASQLEGLNITEWAAAGALANLDEIAKADDWDASMPDALKRVMVYDGHYVAVPLNIHRINWVYYNPTLLKELGLEYPQNWDEMNAAIAKADEAGYQGFHHGGRPWQDFTMFESIALGVGGVEFFKKAFYDLDEDALSGDTMLEVFKELRSVASTFDDAYPGRHYTESLKSVAQGDALFTIMGDWSVAYFVTNGYEYGKEYACAPAPQNDGLHPFTINSDAFGFFTQSDPDRIEGQKIVARMVFEEKTQIDFNLKKGSIPARQNLDLSGFSDCQQISQKDLVTAAAEDSLLMSFAQAMAQPGAISGAAEEVITTFIANPETTPEEGVELLATAIAAAQ